MKKFICLLLTATMFAVGCSDETKEEKAKHAAKDSMKNYSAMQKISSEAGYFILSTENMTQENVTFLMKKTKRFIQLGKEILKNDEVEGVYLYGRSTIVNQIAVAKAYLNNLKIRQTTLNTERTNAQISGSGGAI